MSNLLILLLNADTSLIPVSRAFNAKASGEEVRCLPYWFCFSGRNISMFGTATHAIIYYSLLDTGIAGA